jgi:general secretion pathway protein K
MNCRAGCILWRGRTLKSPSLDTSSASEVGGKGGSTEAARRSSESGFALLLVIWVLALLAVLAASVAADSRSEAVIARNRLTAAQARALADAGVALAVMGLIDPNPVTRWRADGHPQSIQYGDGSATLAVEDEGGKIDLNSAPIELIGGLLDEFGIAPDERSVITNGILDRRREFATPNSLVPTRANLLGGAVPADLGTQPFADASELRLIPGVTRATYERLLPFVTVYSMSPTINPITATREVLLGVPGINPQEVDFFLASRDQTAASIEKPPLSGVDRYIRIADLSAATIVAAAKTGSGASFTREVVAMISPNLAIQPYRILRWRQPFDLPAADENEATTQ